MDTSKYYFSNIIEDDVLSLVAVRSQHMMEENEHIIKVFKINNFILYGRSPRQALYLMRQNNKSIFSQSSSKENSPSSSKSPEGISTPIRCNPEASYMPRSLPLDDTDEKEQHPSKSEFSTPILSRKPINQSVFEEILNPDFEKFRTRDEQLASKVKPETGSQESSPTTEITRMTTKLTMAEKEVSNSAKVVGRIDAISQESPRSSVIKGTILNPNFDKFRIGDEQFGSMIGSETSSQESSPTTEIVRLTTKLTVTEKEIGTPAKVIGRIDASSQESPRPSVIVQALPRLSVDEMVFGSPSKQVCNVKLGNQESPRSAEITRLTSSFTVDVKKSRFIFGEEQMAFDSATNKDSPNQKENARRSRNPNLTVKNEDRIKTSESTPSLLRELLLEACDTHSPTKRTKFCSVPTSDTQWLDIPALKDKIENLLEDKEASLSRMPDAIPNISPIETMSEIRRDDRKRKSLSPTRRSNTSFKSIPRVIKLECEEEMGVEVIDLDYGANPTTSRSKSADYRSDSPKYRSNASPVHCEPKTKSSPRTRERVLRPSERVVASGSSRNVSLTNSPVSDDDVFARKSPLCSLSIVATGTRDKCGALEYTVKDIEDNPKLLPVIVLKFKTLLELRDRFVRISFDHFKNFRVCINFLTICVNNILHILNLIEETGRYSTEEVKEIVCDAKVLSQRLFSKFGPWKKEVENDIDTFQSCIQQIEQLKTEYEPIFTNENETAVIFEVVRAYENEMRAIWKKIDDMVMQGNSRRSLFCHIYYDVERLIKMLVKALILVGVLQAR